jgi:hypothetical protein
MMRMPARLGREVLLSGRKAVKSLYQVGKPATVEALFCNDPIDEADHQEKLHATGNEMTARTP